MNLILYKCVNVHATLMDNDTYDDSKIFKLENEDYTNFVLTKLGLTESSSQVTIS